MRAKTLPVVLGVVLFLDWRVGFTAVISRWTFFTLLNERANISGVKISSSSTILFVVIIHAHLVVVLYRDITRTNFENVQI
jgi:hypothetical protein